MNKLTFLLSFLMLAFAATAQDATTDFKPEAGEKSLETTLYSGFNTHGLRYRAFSSPTNAFRLSTTANYSYSKIANNGSMTELGVWIAPGLEKHFAGTSRLSPYIGAELPIGFRRSKLENDEVLIKGRGSYSSDVNGTTTWYGTGPSSVSVGLNGVAGVDFYISKKFYTGIEFSTGVSYRNEADSETIYKNTAQSSMTRKGYHEINFSVFQSAGLRLGFVF